MKADNPIALPPSGDDIAQKSIRASTHDRAIGVIGRPHWQCSRAWAIAFARFAMTGRAVFFIESLALLNRTGQMERGSIRQNV